MKPFLEEEHCRSFLERYCCNKAQDEQCMLNECEQCQSRLEEEFGKISYLDLNGNVNNGLQRWVKLDDGKIDKVTTEVTYNDVIKMLKADLPAIKQHCYIKWEQASFFQKIRDESENNHHICVAQVDYAENYCCAVQDEIQQHHFKGGNQV